MFATSINLISRFALALGGTYAAPTLQLLSLLRLLCRACLTLEDDCVTFDKVKSSLARLNRINYEEREYGDDEDSFSFPLTHHDFIYLSASFPSLWK